MNAFCYLCQKNGQYGTNMMFLSGLKSQHSKKTCIDIFNEMLSGFLPQRKLQTESNCSICTNCFNLIEDYDFHCISVEARKKELRQMLVRTEVLRIARNKNITIKRTIHMEIKPNEVKISSDEETGESAIPNDSLKLIVIPPKKTSPIVIPPVKSSPIVMPPEESSPQPQPKPIDNVQLQSIVLKNWPPRTYHPKRCKVNKQLDFLLKFILNADSSLCISSK